MLKIYASVLFKNYVNFKGRSRRKEFWIYFFLSGIIYLGLKSILGYISPAEDLFLDLFIITTLIPGIAVGVRRMHDINKSGWYFFFPLYNIYLCTVMGDTGANKYGDDPITEKEYLMELGKDLN